jgi:ribonuclease D
MINEVEWIRDSGALEALLGAIGSGPVSIDSESDSLHHYPEKVCLIQLSFSGRDFLVDPLAGVDPRALGPVLADPGVTKILHGADYDLRALHRDFGLRVRGLFDTMIAARLVGERAFGLAALLAEYYNVALDKRFQRADWSRRPLSGEMESYAAMDTRYLQALAERLGARLESLGRSAWAAEEFRRLEAVRWNESVDPDAFRRVKGSAGLDRRALAILRELHRLREREARRAGRPPFRVLRDDQLLRLARAAPRDEADLSGLPPRWRRGGAARRLLEVVGLGLDCPDSELPEPLPARPRRTGARRDSVWRRIRRERDRIARRLDLEPSVVASRSALEDAIGCLERGEDPAGARDMRRWQLELLLPALDRVAGRGGPG